PVLDLLLVPTRRGGPGQSSEPGAVDVRPASRSPPRDRGRRDLRPRGVVSGVDRRVLAGDGDPAAPVVVELGRNEALRRDVVRPVDVSPNEEVAVDADAAAVCPPEVQWLPSTRVGRPPDSRRIGPKTTVVREDERGVAMRAGLGDENDTLIRGVKRPKVRGDAQAAVVGVGVEDARRPVGAIGAVVHLDAPLGVDLNAAPEVRRPPFWGFLSGELELATPE